MRISTRDTGKYRPRQLGQVLADTHETVGGELHPKGGRNAENISPSSDKVFAFTCIVCEKTSKSPLVNKTKAIDEGRAHRGCQFCGAKPFNQRPVKPRYLSAELVSQIVPEPRSKKKLLPPHLLCDNSHELRLWRCDCTASGQGIGGKKKPREFIYAATVKARTRSKNPQDCPRCSYSGPRVNESNRERYDKYLQMLVKDSRNRGYLSLINEFPLRHNAYFRCAKKGHVFYSSIDQMIKKNDCPTCYSESIKGTNLADRAFKHLHSEFLGPANPFYKKFKMQDIPSGSRLIVVWWRCKDNPLHKWKAYPVRRTRDKEGCPYCRHKRLAKGESLADLFEDIAAEFDSCRNISAKDGQPISASSLRCTDANKYWFLCDFGHSYKASIVARTRDGKGCHYCDILPQSLFKLMPELASEWHYKRNGKLFPEHTPESVTLSSNKKVWWICRVDRKHRWQAVIKDRAKKSSGCPDCHGHPRRDKTIKELYPYLEDAFNGGSNEKSADKTNAVLRQTYSWQCECKEVFPRKLGDVVRRSCLCRACSVAKTRPGQMKVRDASQR